MKYGFVFPGGEARIAAEFAQLAEDAGWDGFFVWEPVWGEDAWVSLAAAAMRTQRIRLGTMLTPVSRRRPWKLASETATLDRLSNGRLILSVGLGALESGFVAFGEVTDRKLRAERLDEGLELITRLWSSTPFDYEGKHFQAHVSHETILTPWPASPLQKPRIPIWVVGAWPSKRSLRRALRYDGLLPAVIDHNGSVRMSPPTPDEVAQIAAYVAEQRRAFAGTQESDRQFDIVVEGETAVENFVDAIAHVTAYAQAGATWWIEAQWQAPDLAHVRQRLEAGPPR